MCRNSASFVSQIFLTNLIFYECDDELSEIIDIYIDIHVMFW